MQYGGYSPSPSPAPQSGPPARYNLLNKLQHQQTFQQAHHPPHSQHSFTYPGPPASPAYNNQQPHPQHHNSLPPQQQHQLNHGPPPGHHHLAGPNGANANGAPSPHPSQPTGPISPHWQQQLTQASISRQAHSPHHHARAAHVAGRGAGTSAITITDPRTMTAATNGRKEALEPFARTSSQVSLRMGTPAPGAKEAKEFNGGSPTAGAAGLDGGAGGDKTSWTTIDMGGMNLKNISPELFRYSFLTTLYIPHNALSALPPLLSKLKHLTLLDASSNKLTSLPTELGLMTSLKELLLFDNHLTTLPPELGTLFNLETLGIEGNPLPDQLRELIQKDGTTALVNYLRDSCPVPLPPPERDWIPLEPDLPTADNDKPAESFSVLSYNILCEKYATPQMYGYTPSWALGWDYRKELIMQEVMNYSADILCLQEVAVEQYESFFLKHLEEHGYDGVYYPKSRARTMTGEEKKLVDGCAVFYKSSTFALVEQHMIEFNQIAMRRTDFKKTEDMFNRVMTKDNIAVVVLLEHRNSGARLMVANNHVTANPEFRDVKLVQVAMLMDELHKIGNDFAKLPPRLHLGPGHDKAPNYRNGSEIPTLVCGDFNSGPDSGVYEFLVHGEVDKAHEDFMDHVYGNYTTDGLRHRLALKSAYSHIGELAFTNYTPGFQGVLDYLFYTTNALTVKGVLGHIDKDYMSRVVGFPNAHWPSDHLSVLAEFGLKL